jgi:hypothetical protein
MAADLRISEDHQSVTFAAWLFISLFPLLFTAAWFQAAAFPSPVPVLVRSYGGQEWPKAIAQRRELGERS